MSRTNPYKQKRRQVSKTLLVFGEGFGEEMFLKHLKSLYHSRDNGIGIKIYKGKGGDPYNIIIDAYKVPGAFDRKIVVLDNDKTETEIIKARQEAKKRSIELIENTPCLEFVLVSILDKKPHSRDSKWCKGEFESKYLDKKKRSELDEYLKLFPKDLLDKQRVKISELDSLISIMEGR